MQLLMIYFNAWVIKAGAFMGKYLFYIIILSFLIISQLIAQDSLQITVIAPMEGGTYKIEINPGEGPQTSHNSLPPLRDYPQPHV